MSQAPLGLVAVVAGMILLLVAARLDRHLLKGRLQVLDGTVGHEDIGLEATGGGRS